MSESAPATRLSVALKGEQAHGPVPEAEIAKAERELGVPFPPSLRSFIGEFGATFDIAGLPVSDWSRPGEMPQWSDLVAETKRARAGWAEFPSALVFVSHDGVECSYFIDTAAVGIDGESPVVALEPGRDFVIVAGSFVEFLERLARGERP